MRYVLAAKRTSDLDANWTLVIDAKEAVTDCDPAEERKKGALKESSQLASKGARDDG